MKNKNDEQGTRLILDKLIQLFLNLNNLFVNRKIQFQQKCEDSI